MQNAKMQDLTPMTTLREVMIYYCFPFSDETDTAICRALLFTFHELRFTDTPRDRLKQSTNVKNKDLTPIQPLTLHQNLK